MSPRVSILVPVYNVSQYIEKCAKSLFEQTFQDIEFIFVNDATPDDSIEKLLKVIEKYPNRKTQIKIIHHPENKGLAASRNTALNASTGDYISVADSDDYVEKEMIETLYRKAETENADIVISDILLEYQDKTIFFQDYLPENKNEQLANLLKFEQSSPALWNKLILRTLYTRPDCRVPEGLNYMEDRHVMVRLFFFAQKIVKVNKAFYHYVQYNVNSITKTKNRMHFDNVILFWLLLDTFIKQHHEYNKFEQIIGTTKTQNKIQLMIGTNSSNLRKEYSNIFQEEEMKHRKEFKKVERLMLFLVRNKFYNFAQLLRFLLVFKNKYLKFR